MISQLQALLGLHGDLEYTRILSVQYFIHIVYRHQGFEPDGPLDEERSIRSLKDAADCILLTRVPIAVIVFLCYTSQHQFYEFVSFVFIYERGHDVYKHSARFMITIISLKTSIYLNFHNFMFILHLDDTILQFKFTSL